VILAAIHLGLTYMGESTYNYVLANFAFRPILFSWAAQSHQIPLPVYWSGLTYALLHANFTHLFFNVLWLIIFGTPVARRMSGIAFFAIAAVGSCAGALITLLLHWNEEVTMIGASAAVAALMAAAVPIMFGDGNMWGRTATHASARNAPILPLANLMNHRPAQIFMLVIMGITLMTGAAQLIGTTAFLSDQQVAWEAHVGGFLSGLLMFYALDKGPVHGPR
jgi:membrane associated rhomboid family serine protease